MNTIRAGSLDVERIKKLPTEEFITEIGSLTEKQYTYFCANIPLNEGRGQSTKAVTLDESFDNDVDTSYFFRKQEVKSQNFK